ncbi:hypothetical protein WJX84_008276 [Apatococcus fuscideae]|uniref:Uncharacterized protein n=1 Tax=Apatococcus fuscideae TaxID=2026836 RepID=A0AAW1TE80_9CHLO
MTHPNAGTVANSRPSGSEATKFEAGLGLHRGDQQPVADGDISFTSRPEQSRQPQGFLSSGSQREPAPGRPSVKHGLQPRLQPSGAPSHRKVVNRSVRQVGLDAPLLLDHTEDQLDPAVLAALPAAMQREIKLAFMAGSRSDRPKGQIETQAKEAIHGQWH